MKDQEYIDQARQALLSFQMLEQGLKVYIGLYVKTEKLSGCPDKELDHLVSDLEGTPLSFLIKRFKKTKPNEIIVKNLEVGELLDWRNFLAHNAFQHELISRSSNSHFTHHTAVDVAKVGVYVGNLALDIGEEIKRLQGRHASLANRQ